MRPQLRQARRTNQRGTTALAREQHTALLECLTDGSDAQGKLIGRQIIRAGAATAHAGIAVASGKLAARKYQGARSKFDHLMPDHQ